MSKACLVCAVAAVALVSGCSSIDDEGRKLPPSWAATFPGSLDGMANCLTGQATSPGSRVRQLDDLHDVPALSELRHTQGHGVAKRCARG
jgi:hypothetical protein